MKNIFTAEEIKSGMLIIKNSAGRPFTDLAYARTITYKIGYSHDSEMKYGLSSVLTDGFYVGVANSLKDMATYLNKDDDGYRPITKEEFIQLLVSSEQGFY